MFSLVVEAATLPPAARAAALAALAPGLLAPDTVLCTGLVRLDVPEAVVPTLAHAGAEPLREAMARSARLSTALATILAQDPAPRVVAALIANPRTPGAVLAQVAGRADLSPLLLAALREHPHCSAALSAQIQARLRAMSA